MKNKEVDILIGKKIREFIVSRYLVCKKCYKKLFTQDMIILKRNYELRKTVMLKFDRKQGFWKANFWKQIFENKILESNHPSMKS